MKSIMEFIRTFREKQMSSRQNNITQEAHDCICLQDFDDKIYISHNGVPLLPIEDNWTPKQIITKLEETRNSYINYKMKQANSSSSISFL